MAFSHGMNSELSLFVREALTKGKSRKDVHAALKKAGWQEDEIRTAVEAYADMDFAVPVPKRKPYLSAGEAFRYLVLFLTLYFSAFSFGTILFQAINRNIPDFIYGGYTAIDDSTIASTMRLATSTLVVSFPLFLWLSGIIARAVGRDPDKRSSRVRKWLTYITLFIAAAIIIGDVITLVYNFLGGELTLRFALKCLVVGAITGSVFGYYLLDLRGDEADKDKPSKPLRHDTPGFRAFLGIVVLSVTGALIYGFWTAGSPSTERAKRLDTQRLNDIQQISYAVNAYWSARGSLPSAIADLRTEPNVYLQSASDPETGVMYEYRLVDDKTYEVCGMFSLPSQPTEGLTGPSRPYKGSDQPFWEHGAGHSCFTLKAPQPQPGQPGPIPVPMVK